ncbi:vascular cell adhesion protein 1-like, partial [Micropterus dolomieu]|uniref:vascular cell adhesion protein 1-like n=1 Tax=Micropterus dolomieu TaxID=147949 RepID=UPI001E8ED320
SPRIEIPADLKEKQSVTITCSASTPCPHSPPKLTWNLQQDSHSNTEENTDRTFTTKIQETITLSDQHDGYNITCSARYPVNEGKDVKTAEERKTLSVSYAPKNTSVSISPSGLVSAGSWVNLTCSSRAKPPVSRFTWFKSSKDGPKNVSEGEVYSFKVTSVTDGGVYYCVATNDLGNQTSSEIHRKETDIRSVQWQAILGGIVGIIALICLVVCVWCLKSTRPTTQQTQSQAGEELAVEDPAGKTEEKERDILYREIDFSKRRAAPSSDSVQDSGQQQDTLYAQISTLKLRIE